MEWRYSFILSLTSSLYWVGGQTTPQSLYPQKIGLVSNVQEAGWVSEPVWIRVENYTHTWVWTPDHSACSKLLYQLRYPGHNDDKGSHEVEFSYSVTIIK
jgi:hypothetical protein